ncbi:hypothetical protein FOL47_008597 [Perkinsus chesapeaki]|uniref:Amino acid transporter transmembrane domain-containing protein n=1 Tax=Perkinsus chesapeaki TaxID=330153 RepID=A0A7J6MTE1_PERCH|nr:hypothetical protein FOL47_008597 [Perkinsus chesapeaki]
MSQMNLSDSPTTTIRTASSVAEEDSLDSKPSIPVMDDPDEGKCSNLRSILNIILTAIGLGVITLPTVMAKCGWIGGVIVLFFGAALSDYMVWKLYQAVTNHPKGDPINTYEELGRVCYGRVGQIVTALIVHVTMIGVCSTLLLLLGENTQKLAPQLSVTVWCVIWAAVCTPLSWIRSLKDLSYVALVGLLGIIAVFIIIAAKGIENGITTDEDIQYDLISNDPLNWAISIGNAVLSYQIASATPNLLREMKTPSAFPKVATVSFFIVFAIYVGVGACGYYGYGRDLIEVPILDSIAPADEPLNAWGYALVISMLALAFPHYLVLLMPIAASLEYVIKVDINSSSKRDFIKRALARTFLVAITLVIAITVPSVNNLIDLMSVFTVIAMAAILPALFYVRMKVLNKGSLMAVIKSNWIEMSTMLILTLLCLLLMGAGGYVAIVNF